MEPIYEHFTNLLQYIGDLVFITDAEGIVREYNMAGEYILGYSREDVLTRPICDFWVNRKQCRETLKWVMDSASVYVSNIETLFRKKDGREVYLSLTLSKYKNGNGIPLGVMGIGRDITEKKRVETELRSIRQELENFVYTISHDLKSPVLSIEGYVSMLIRDYQGTIDEKGQHYLKRIQANIQKMGLLLKDLLELSRSGRVVGDLVEVNAGKVLSAVLEEMDIQIKQRGITLVVADNFPTIRCDRRRFAQVLENLLSNAIKFMGDQANPRIEVGFNNRAETYEFFVRDNGIGIAPQYHERIFSIFQRIEELPQEGTGIGLTITKRIVENHGGNIWVVSEHGKGAAFYFTIPKKRKTG